MADAPGAPEDLEDVAIRGELVVLRAQRPADLEPAFALIHAQDEILRWLLWDGPASREEYAEHFAQWRVPGDPGDDWQLSIEERTSGALVGQLGLRFAGHPEMGDVGYWIGRPHQGRGYATEALRLAATFAFELLGARALCAWVFVGNHGSRRALEKAGFRLVRTARKRALKRGRAIDEWSFVLLQSDWEVAPRPRAELCVARRAP